jgi:hypothetical protein
VRIKLLKPTPYIGENRMGKYYLYSVADESGIEMAYFATEPVHNLIQSNQLKVGSLIQLAKKAKGIEFSIIGQAVPEPPPAAVVQVAANDQPGDGLKAILLQCVKDAAEVIRDSGIQMGNDELQKLATTLFIQRAKAA